MEKYSGCGNTFFITMYDKTLDTPEKAKEICNNEVDGFIMVKTNPLTFHMYNQDGTIANMCGNGIRCFTHFCYNHKVITELKNDVHTIPGIYHTEITSTDPFMVKVNMVKPKYEYFDGKIHINEQLKFEDESYSISYINTGVWHVVIPFYNDIEYNNALKKAKDIYYCDKFKGRHNINFVNVREDGYFLRTFEYGVNDFTDACGTGSTATFLILKHLGVINTNSAEIINKGGTLKISVDDNDEVYMEGPSIILSK